MLHTGELVGEYRITGVVGSGATGQVYEVEHTITRRREAMKVLVSGRANAEEQAQRFLREIQIQASLSHPNIAEVHNAFWADDDLMLVMELVPGEPLKAVLERGRLPVARALDCARQALRALEYAHAHGVVHRDIKPANMIITPQGVVKLTDFGLAKARGDPKLTHSGAIVGSPYYIAPEQVNDVLTLDARTDVYSLGVVLYEMVTGCRPFEGDNSFAVMLAHLERPPKPPTELEVEVPAELNRIILKALEKQPERRFQSAAEFREGLDKVRPARSRARQARRGLWWGLGAVAAAVLLMSLPSARRQPPAPAPTVVRRDRPASPAEARSQIARTPAPAPASPAEPRPAGSYREVRSLQTGVVRAVTFSGEGRWLAAGTEPGTVEIWDAATGNKHATLKGHTAQVVAVAFSPNGEALVSGSGDGTARVWDVASGTQRRTLPQRGFVSSLAFSTDGQWLAAGSSDGLVKLWPLNRRGQEQELRDHKREPRALAFSPKGDELVSVSSEKLIRRWAVREGRLRARQGGVERGPMAVAFSLDGRSIAVAGFDWVKVIVVESGRELRSLNLPGWLHALAFTTDGACLALSATAETVKLWDVTNRKELATLAGSKGAQALAIGPEGRRLATASAHGRISIWERP